MRTCILHVLTLASLLTLCTGDAMDCPIEIYPERVVVRYGDPVAANCTVTQTTSGMGWEATVGPTGMQNDTSLLWRVSNLTDWNEEPRCFGIFLTEPIRCEKNLSISLYKYPDSVSISSVGHTGPMEEGRQYRLQCDVQSIAPVQYLSVNWYRGGALIHTLNFSEDTTRTPVNVSPTLLITPSRTDDGVQYTCEAELRLGPGGPQANQSEPLNITVLYCPIVIDPPTVVVRYGDPVEVNCTVTRTTRGMGWEASVGSIDMKTDVQSLLWSASSLTDWTAEPKCFANFKTEPKQCKKELNVTLYKYPDRVSISSVGHTGPMEEGRQYRLQCDVQSIAPVQYLSVNWYRGGALIRTETFTEDTTRTPVNVSRTLLITPNRTDDRVQYTCEAELRLGPGGPQPNPVMKSEPLNATVLYGPELSGCRDHVEVTEHQTLGDSVVCTVQGSPAPETSWLKDGREVDASAPLSRTDGGLYTYRAFNTYGSTTHNVSVEVLYGPELSGCRDHVEVTEHQTLGDSVVCTVQGSPAPETSWLKDGREVDASAPLSRTDGGLYTYRAFNTYGSTTHNVSVEVLYGPELSGCRDHVEVTEHQTLGDSVVCTVQGSPAPETSWIKDGREVDASAPLSRTDGGLYTYRAFNTYGSTTHNVSVEVLYCPIVIDPPTVVVRYGDPVEVNCTVTRTTRGMGWEATVGSIDMKTDVQSLLWSASSLTDWTAEPKCFAKIQTESKQCKKELNVTLYKYPDRVSISSVGHTGPMEEGRQYRLQCDVQSIAPVQYLSVNWYRGGALIHTETFTEDTTRTPVNVSRTLLITPNRTDDRVQYTCEAELRLGPGGPQPNPVMKSEPLNATVLYGPELSGCRDHVEVTEHQTLGDSVVCTVQGSPAPETSWLKDGREVDASAPLSRTDGGLYTYRAFNTYGSTTHNVSVEVLYGPELSGCRDHVEVTEHQTLGDSVVCTVQGSPAPETSWIKDGREVDASAPLRRTDGGLYTYRAFNTYGSTTHNVSVEVLYCPIVIDPPTVVVRYGDPVEVNCTVTRTTRGMGWEATVGSIDMKTDVQSLLWSASSLTDWTAEPKCYANFKTAPKQCKKELNVTLYKYPDRVSISSVGHTGPMEEGRQYRLQCDVQSIAPVQYLSVNWYRGGALIHTETFTEDTTRTPVNVSRTLLITPNRTDDRVQYTCEAELRLGPGGPQPNPVMKSEPLNATVLYGPELSRCQDRVEVMENQTLGDSVVCTVQGSPAPETSWIKDGREVDASAPLSRTDGGLYTYRAFNTYGSTTHNVSVEVLYKPVFKSKSEDSLSIYQGELLVLNCSAHGNPPPKYHWKYSEALNKEERDIGDGSTYNVSEASPGQSGFYTCTVSNKQGETSQKFSVTVKEKDGGSAIIIGIIVGIIFLILLVILICAFIKDYRHKRGNYIIVGQQGSQANGSLLHNGHSDGIALETLPTV